MKAGRYDEALRLAEQAHLEGNPKNPFWLTRQAAACARAGRYQKSLKAAEEAIALDPFNPYCMFVLAEALKGLNRFEDALEYYETIGDDPKLALSARRGILYCLSNLKRWEAMGQCLAQWELPPATELRYKVKALSGQKRVAEAIEACGRWLAIKPDNRQALWELAEPILPIRPKPHWCNRPKKRSKSCERVPIMPPRTSFMPVPFPTRR